MRLETCIRKGLRLKSHRVQQVREELDRLVAEIEWIPGRTLICSNCSRRTARIHARQVQREWRDLSVRDRPLVLRYAPVRVRCPVCGPRVEHLPWAHKWQRITKALAGVIARLSRQLSRKETAAAYVLMQQIRLRAAGTALATAQVTTLRERLLKMAAWVQRSVRRIVIHFPVNYPWLDCWKHIAQATFVTS